MTAPAQSLASHLINQTLSSIALLESLNVINSTDAHTIRSKLPPPTGPFPSLNVPNSTQSDLSQSFNGLNVSPQTPYRPQQHSQPPPQPPQYQTPQGYTSPPPAGPPSLPPRGPRPEQRATALWDYNGAEADDLTFRQGDTLIIDEEVNEQWYRGRVIPVGQTYPLERSGLFPSNYIEKIQSVQPPYPSGPGPMVPYQQQQQQTPQQQSYGYDKAPQHYGQVVHQPPPQHMGMMQHQQGPPQQIVVSPEEKKSKFGKIGGQLGNAAVNGAGFGFGASIASEMVHKIF